MSVTQNRKTKESNLFAVLEKIKQQPGLYIGRPSVSDLFLFLMGYKFAQKQLGVVPNELELNFYEKFHEFVEQKYNLKTANAWSKIIMLYSPDEKTGFEMFFKLLSQFQANSEVQNGNGQV